MDNNSNTQEIQDGNFLTHGTIHGHIHTYDNNHKHIHGHIHKHHHPLNSFQQVPDSSKHQGNTNVGGQLLVSGNGNTDNGNKNISSLTPNLDDVKPGNKQNRNPILDLTDSQIQQIIDQCSFNESVDRCFDSSCNDISVHNNLSPDSNDCEEYECCDDSNCISKDASCCYVSPNQYCTDHCDYHCQHSNQINSPAPSTSISPASANSPNTYHHMHTDLSSLFNDIDDIECCFDPNHLKQKNINHGNKTGDTGKNDCCFEYCNFDNHPAGLTNNFIDHSCAISNGNKNDHHKHNIRFAANCCSDGTNSNEFHGHIANKSISLNSEIALPLMVSPITDPTNSKTMYNKNCNNTDIAKSHSNGSVSNGAIQNYIPNSFDDVLRKNYGNLSIDNSTQSKLSDLRTKTTPSFNTGINFCSGRPHSEKRKQNYIGENNLGFKDIVKRAKKLSNSSNSTIEEFNYNWVNFNDLPLQVPMLRSHLKNHNDKIKLTDNANTKYTSNETAFVNNKKNLESDHIHCLWENCPSNILKYNTNEQLQSHILKDHILQSNQTAQSYQPPIKENKDSDNFKNNRTASSGADTSSLPSQANYHCEWMGCNFESDDILKFLSHIPTIHGFGVDSNMGNQGPSMNDNYNNAIFEEKIKTEDLMTTPISIETNTNKISGKEENSDTDPDHRCKWELATKNGSIICNRTFSTTDELTDHIIDDHIGGGKSSYVCNWENCSRNHKLFNQRQKIIRHLHVHTKHKPYECIICGKRFSIDLMLEQHIRIHTGEKPYRCSICGKWFKTSSSLSIHSRIHTGKKPLACKYPNCSKKFNESSNLTKHYKIHERFFKCHKCTKTFNREEKLINHLKLCHNVNDGEAYQYLKKKFDNFKNPYYVKDGEKSDVHDDNDSSS
ncbi:hypothetical protein PACTADRAFT_69257 [Pachysolen tannophilus NRRL Y-2460]|uniref:C2H2-type domain-containing protein n=1 Tax=Pachysolen tannophilus NRRL Y-2460 TaxID=669874 RepID=A0A1E4TVM3_PACTA|nr:hypothetical protein PACTADRAFT_69257 [Pachysolen tannophilus NRRL Y-2460]